MAKTYGASGGTDDLQYGYNYEYLTAIEQSPDGGYVAAGYSTSVMKLDAKRNCVWSEALSEVTNSSKLLTRHTSLRLNLSWPCLTEYRDCG